MYWGVRPPLLAQVLLEIATDPTARNADRIAAAREILDRGWGKAGGFADIEGADPLGMGEVEAEIGRIAEELARDATRELVRTLAFTDASISAILSLSSSGSSW